MSESWDEPIVQERLIRLLEALAGIGRPASVQDLVGITGLPRATIYRNLASLMDCGFVEESPTPNRYVLGMRFIKIALTGKADTHVINAVSSVLYKVVKDLGETAFLARYRTGRVDLIHIEIPSDPAVSHIYPGMGLRPAHACSSAKAIAAFINPDMREELLQTDPQQFTERTLIDRDEIRQEILRIQTQGYAVCDGEIEEGVTSVAVPINVDRLGAIFSMGVVGPSVRIGRAIEDPIVPVLRNEAIRAAAAIQHCSIVEAETTNAEAFSAAREEQRQSH